MTRVYLKRIETVENIFLGTGKTPPKLGIPTVFEYKKVTSLELAEMKAFLN